MESRTSPFRFHFAQSAVSRLKTAGIAAAMVALAAGVSSCASTKENERERPLASDAGVSTIPWNSPQNWEGRGMLGGYADSFNSR